MKNSIFRKTIALIIFLFPTISFAEAHINVANHIDFGDLLGFTGSCEMDGATGVIGNQIGAFCLPDKTGTPGFYIVVSSPNTVVRIKINKRNNTGDGIRYTPSGVYQVHGELDTAIIADQFQDINTGSTGNIFIKLGGVLSAAEVLNFGTTYSYTNLVGIEWNELP